MKMGAWFYTADGAPLEEQLALAAQKGLKSARIYSIGYAEQPAPALRQFNLSLLAGMHINTQELLRDWHSKPRLAELAKYHALGISLESVR